MLWYCAGSCACFMGYVGTDCNSCDRDYVWVPDAAQCVFLPGTLSSCVDGVLNGNEKDVDCGGPNCEPCSIVATWVASRSPWLVNGIVIGCCVALAIGLVVVILYKKHKNHPEDASSGDTGGIINKSTTKTTSVVPWTRSMKSPGTRSPTRSDLKSQGIQGLGGRDRDDSAGDKAVPSRSRNGHPRLTSVITTVQVVPCVPRHDDDTTGSDSN